MISFCGCCCPSVVEWYPVWSFSKMLSETQIHLTYLHKDLSLLFQPFTPGSSEIYARRSTPIALNGKLEHCFQSDTDFHIKPWMCPVIIGAGSNFPLVETSGKGKSGLQTCKCETDFFTLICTSFLNRNLMPFGFKFLNFHGILRK